ncbi:hypothetical protein MNBD_GAMMA13-244 [hydrothermal vent metagenome]|uniref:HTH cro/C1-type domain-containing protein n=1 Tax=hydrothermal vent metagenome TaxID=652676 RepID=A0A3B0YLG3_9ZZZZ
MSPKSLSQQMRDRRKQLGLRQGDMALRIGMSQQHYQRVEAGHDVRLSTLLRIADGLKLDIMLMPKEHSAEVQASLSELEAGATTVTPGHGQLGESAAPGHWDDLVDDSDD